MFAKEAQLPSVRVTHNSVPLNQDRPLHTRAFASESCSGAGLTLHYTRGAVRGGYDPWDSSSTGRPTFHVPMKASRVE